MADKVCKPRYWSKEAKSLIGSKLMEGLASIKNSTLFEESKAVNVQSRLTGDSTLPTHTFFGKKRKRHAQGDWHLLSRTLNFLW